MTPTLVALRRAMTRSRLLAAAAALAVGLGVVGALWSAGLTAYGETPADADTVVAAPEESSDDGSPEAGAVGRDGTPVQTVERPATVAQRLDGIGPEELDYARYLAASTPEYATTTDVNGAVGAQLVSSAVDTGVDDDARRLLLTYYDYTSFQALVFRIDMSAGAVTSVGTTDGAAATPSPEENRAALEILLSSKDTGTIQGQYAAVEGEQLTASTPLTLLGRALTDPATGNCAQSRCVVLITQTASGAFLSTQEFAVDLGSRTVLPLEGGADHDHSSHSDTEPHSHED